MSLVGFTHGPPIVLPLGGGPFYVYHENQRRNEEDKMSTTRKKPIVGDAIVYHNERGVGHNGLITCVWGEYMINVVYVSSNETQKDDYGRQTIHESSVSMIGQPGHSTAHGRYARYPHEEAVPYVAPLAV